MLVRAISLSIDACMYQQLLCSMLGPKLKNRIFVGLGFLYRTCAFSSLVSLPVLTDSCTHYCCWIVNSLMWNP